MVLLTLGDLKTAVELLSQNKSGHEMGERDISEADPSVGSGADFRRNAVAAANHYLQCAAALFDV